MSPDRTSGTDEGLPIGAVVRRLQTEFIDLTVSKVRYLEAAGLVSPRRLDSGLRRYTPQDVQRLRFVLAAQRDRFWPLKVIKDALDRIDRGLDPEPGDQPTGAAPALGAAPGEGSGDGVGTGGPRAGSAAALPDAEQLRRRRTVRLTPAELRERTGLDLTTYTALKGFGLLTTDAAGRHGADDADVARECAALASYGLEPRHLRLFRAGADREIGLTEQILEPVRRRRARGAPDADPEDLQARLLAHSVALHVALVRAGLERSR